jgi:TPR repeat protein
MTPGPQLARQNRRRSLRHRVHAPAYASFSGAPKGKFLNLNEVLDLSEGGAAIQCAFPPEVAGTFDLYLDLAEAGGQIQTTGQVVWSDEHGRAGFRFPVLPESTLQQLRQWLFLNAMVAAANAQSALPPGATAPRGGLRPDYTDTLATLSAVQREAESLGSDLAAALGLIATRSQALVRASGAAIALAAENPAVMVCRASSGAGVPSVGAELQVGSGLSGECVRTGRVLRCDDSETDTRVDRESCRVLGIRSLLVAPLRMGPSVIGLIEVFSPHADAFGANETAVMQRLAETTIAAVNRSSPSLNLVAAPANAPSAFVPPAGSVLFASVAPKKSAEESAISGGMHLPRVHLILLVVAAATIALALGFLLAPWIQEKLQSRNRKKDSSQTVLASSKPSDAPPLSPPPSVATVSDVATLEQLQQLAGRGDPAAQYALGARYAFGDGVTQDYSEAMHWFSRAADQGHVVSQATLGAYYMAGRGVPVDLSKAYFWACLARAGGDPGSKLRVQMLSGQMPRSQTIALEQQADQWLHDRHSPESSFPAR